MLTQFFSVSLIVLLGAMLPGPDFAMVTKNTVVHDRRAGLFTSLGIGCGLLIHITYCVLGLAIVISQSLLLFNIIKYIGAAYLIYLGISSLLTKHVEHIDAPHKPTHKKKMSDFKAFRQGFLCNLLNPKATLFFLALFTVVIKPDTSSFWMSIYAIEIFTIVTTWFCCLTLFLSHRRIIRILDKAQKYITKTLGVFLVGFGVALAFVKK